MEEQLEQDQGLTTENVENINPESAGEESTGSEDQQPEIPEWRKAIDEELSKVREEHQRERKRSEHGFGKSIAKVRRENKMLRDTIAKMIPDSSSMQFESDDQRKQYESYVKPIHDEMTETEQRYAKEEQEAETQARQAQMVSSVDKALTKLPNYQEVANGYNRMVSENPDLAIDEDIAIAVQSDPALFVELYSNPQEVLNLKSMSPTAKAFRLVGLSQSMNSAQVQAPKPVPAEKQVNQPASPPRSGNVGGGTRNINDLEGDAYLRAFRQNRKR